MKKLVNRLLVIFVVLVGLSLVACHKPKNYEANVEVTRIHVVRKDETGKPLTTDLEFSFYDCPGTQIEVIRGGKEFSECVASKIKVGEKINIKLLHHWSDEGFYDYGVYEAGGCKRPPDPNDEASYKLVRECNDWKVNGATVGFQCNYTNKKELNKKCPWFVKH
jgi:hypothetical protein